MDAELRTDIFSAIGEGLSQIPGVFWGLVSNLAVDAYEEFGLLKLAGLMLLSGVIIAVLFIAERSR